MTHIIEWFSTITVPPLLVVSTRCDRLGIEIPLADLHTRASRAKILLEESRDACLNAELDSLLNRVRATVTGFPEYPTTLQLLNLPCPPDVQANPLPLSSSADGPHRVIGQAGLKQGIMVLEGPWKSIRSTGRMYLSNRDFELYNPNDRIPD